MGDSHHKLVQNLHNRVANSSDAGFGTVRPRGTNDLDLKRIARSISRKLHLKRTDSLADVGCGNGMLSVHLLRPGLTYVGIDYSNEVLESFRLRMEQLPLRRQVTLLATDITQESHRFGTFGAVLCYASFHYAENDDEARIAMQNLGRMVKPGGRLLLGNLPLEDFWSTLCEAKNHRSRMARFIGVLGWMMRSDYGIVKPLWKIEASLFVLWRKLTLKMQGKSIQTEDLRLSSKVVELNLRKVSAWIAEAIPDGHLEVSPSFAFAPLAIGRADFLVTRPA